MEVTRSLLGQANWPAQLAWCAPAVSPSTPRRLAALPARHLACQHWSPPPVHHLPFTPCILTALPCLQVAAELPSYGSLGPLFFAFGLITRDELRQGAGACSGQGAWPVPDRGSCLPQPTSARCRPPAPRPAGCCFCMHLSARPASHTGGFLPLLLLCLLAYCLRLLLPCLPQPPATATLPHLPPLPFPCCRSGRPRPGCLASRDCG